MRNPIEPRNFICDSHTCVVSSRNPENSKCLFVSLTMRWLIDSEIPSYSVHSCPSKGVSKSTRNDMRYGVVCCLDKSEVEMCLHSPVSRKRNQKIPMVALFVLFLLKLSPNTTCFNSSTPIQTACPHSSRSCSALLMGFLRFVSTVRICENLLLLLFRHLHEIHPMDRCHHQWVLLLYSVHSQKLPSPIPSGTKVRWEPVDCSSCVRVHLCPFSAFQ